MSDIKVPEGMFKAAQDSTLTQWSGVVRIALEAALRWLSENPIVPSNEIVDKIYGQMRNPGERDSIRYGASQFQRYMFLAPEPMPVEDWTDKLLAQFPSGYTPMHAELDKIWETIFPAAHGWTPPPFRDSDKSVAEVDARIPDLLFNSPTHVTIQVAEDRIRRAYRRGHSEGSK